MKTSEKSVQETKAAKQASKGAQGIPQGATFSGVQKSFCL